MRRLKAALLAWLGVPVLIDAEQKRAEAAEIATALELAAKIGEINSALQTLNEHYNSLCQIVMFQQEVLKRWASGSETLRHIEAKHTAHQKGSRILTLGDGAGRVVGGD